MESTDIAQLKMIATLGTDFVGKPDSRGLMHLGSKAAPTSRFLLRHLHKPTERPDRHKIHIAYIVGLAVGRVIADEEIDFTSLKYSEFLDQVAERVNELVLGTYSLRAATELVLADELKCLVEMADSPASPSHWTDSDGLLHDAVCFYAMSVLDELVYLADEYVLRQEIREDNQDETSPPTEVQTLE